MMKRNSVKQGVGKLGVGLMSLMAIGGGGSAAAQAASGGKASTLTQLSFELAMAQAVGEQLAAGATEIDPVSEIDDAGLETPEIETERAPGVQFTTPTVGTAKSRAARQKTGTDGLPEGAAFIEADQIAQTDDEKITAYGQVEMRHNGRIIRADILTYDPATGATTASGNTQTINADGSVQFSDYISYNDEKQSGVSENFASMGADEQKVFARRVEAIDADTNRLTDVIYTPCQLCVVKGETQEPSWSIQASQITQRRNKRMVYYKNAVFKLHGVPVFYAPYMWTPDPEMERASGLLPPRIGFTRKRGGFSYEQPYLWAISPYQYLIISPQVSSGVNPLLNLEYQRNFYSGLLRARIGYTQDSFFDSDGERIGPEATRAYILADGAFKINEDWRWNFTAQHVKDDIAGRDRSYANFFERYDVEDVFNRREGPDELVLDSRQLINQVNLVRQTPTAFFSLRMASFQNLQLNGFVDPITEQEPIAANSDIYPSIGPMLEAHWSPRSRILGGQVTVSLNALGLKHKRYPGDVVAPDAADGTSGFDTARVSAALSYEGDMTTRSGVKWGPFLSARHDTYKLTNLTSAGLEADLSRGLATAGVNVSYPLIKTYINLTAVIEPMAQFAVSPKVEYSPFLPNEDSQAIEFDETTLFEVNRSPGFDVYESGARLNLGVRTRLRFDSGLKLEGLVGRTLRDEDEAQFLRTITQSGTDYTYDPYGMARKASDWVVNASFDTSKGIYGYTRLRIDGEETRVSQGEYGLSARNDSTNGTLRYVFNDVLLRPIVVNGELQRFGDNYRNLQLYARHFFTPNWGVSARLDRDVVEERWKKSQLSVIYRNDCIWYELIYQRNDNDLEIRRNGKPSSAILFRLNLSTLGTSRAEFTDVR